MRTFRKKDGKKGIERIVNKKNCRQLELDLLLDRSSDFYNEVTEKLISQTPEIRFPNFYEQEEIAIWTDYYDEVDPSERPAWCGLRSCPSHNYLGDKCDCIRASFSSYTSKQHFTRNYLNTLFKEIVSEMRVSLDGEHNYEERSGD